MESGPATSRASRRYLIQSRLARGGTGEAFRAISLGEGGAADPVVVKRIIPIHAGRREMAELFLSQARSMSRLSHPNLVRVLDFGLGERGNYYLVEEYVPGLDLRRLCRWLRAREEPLPIAAALHLGAHALRGLAHAHTRSAAEGDPLVHRDVSPGNVLLSADGEVKVADFGVALAARESVAGSAPSLDPISAGRTLLMGTPDYMAPEQFDGEPVDARADLFSVGAVLFEALTGERPFPGSTLSERMDAARCGRAQPARELRPEIPVELEALLARALMPRPEDRFADAPAMAEAIEALLGEERDGRQGSNAREGREALAELVTAAQRELGAGQASLRPPAEGSGEEDDLVGRELVCAEAGGVFTVGRDADEAAAEDGGMRAVLDALGVDEGAAADEGAGRLSAEGVTPSGASTSARPGAAGRGSRRWSGILVLAALAAVGAAVAAGALGQGTQGAVMRAGMMAPRVRAAASAGAGTGAGTGAGAGAGAGTGAGTGAAAGTGPETAPAVVAPAK